MPIGKRHWKHPHNLACHMRELVEEYGRVTAALDACGATGKGGDARPADFAQARAAYEGAQRAFFARFHGCRLAAMAEACRETINLLDGE